MARVVIHLGTEKTGSTTLQSFLDRNRGLLSRHGITTPPELSGLNRNRIVAPFTGEHQDINVALGLHSASDIRRSQEELETLLRPAQGTWILSAEHLSSRLIEDQQVAAFRRWIGSYFDEVTFLMFARRQDFWTTSLYSTAIELGQTHDFDPVSAGHPSFDLSAIVKRWSTYGAPDRFFVFPYLENRPSVELVSEFLRALYLPPSDDWSHPADRLNVRLPLDSLTLLKRANRAIGPYSATPRPKRLRAIRKYLRMRRGAPWLPNANQAAEIADICATSNDEFVAWAQNPSRDRANNPDRWNAWLTEPTQFAQGAQRSLRSQIESRLMDIVIGRDAEEETIKRPANPSRRV